MPIHTTFIGAGPAGLAPLVWAARSGCLMQLAQRGLVIVERGESIGAGSIGRHAISSDTLSETFIECLENSADAELAALHNHATAQALAVHRGGGVALTKAAAFLAALGDVMQASIRSAGGRVVTGSTALEGRQCADGGWLIRLQSGKTETELHSHNIILATGATESRSVLVDLAVAGAPLLPRYSSKLMLSGEVLAAGGAAAVTQRLRGVQDPQVVIVGGSHSAVAAANVLLSKCSEIEYGPSAITVMHRRPLRVFYPSAEAALAEGYTDFSAGDICPVSQRLFRLGGFRLESRELVMRLLGIGGRPPEPRLQLHHLTDEKARVQAQTLLDKADLIVTALGYRPNAIPLSDMTGCSIAIAQYPSPLVDRSSRVLDANGEPLRGVFGIGLAAGFLPGGPLGGEPSFQGQANGLWLWQNGVGAMIVNSLLDQETYHVANAAVG